MSDSSNIAERGTAIRKAVFPAAGLGTRFLPATKAQPKEMLPLVDKPIIQYVVEEAKNAGIDNIIIVTGRGKNAIEDHFDVSVELEAFLRDRDKQDLLIEIRKISDLIKVCYLRQKEPLGLGHAILVTRELIGDEPFAVLLGDDIIDSRRPAIQQLADVYAIHKKTVLAIQEVPETETSAYGIIAGEQIDDRLYRVTSLVEKPPRHEAPSNLAIIGRYILTPDIFPCLERTAADRGGEIQLTNALRLLGQQDEILAYRFEGRRHDAGNKLGFLKATVEFALQREDLGAEFRAYLKTLNL